MGAMRISVGSQYQKTGRPTYKREREFLSLAEQIFASLLPQETKGDRSRKARKRLDLSVR